MLLIVTLVHAQLREFTSIERATKDRKGKIYLDFLQNRPQPPLHQSIPFGRSQERLFPCPCIGMK